MIIIIIEEKDDNGYDVSRLANRLLKNENIHEVQIKNTIHSVPIVILSKKEGKIVYDL
ncbi:MAG: hypothetical protein QXT72_04485 [Candidatus Micrarchaeia archaeon]